jgi:formylglycine-generating enzyme required for sulfatase activity
MPVIEPAMVPLPGGTFAMGSNDDITEKPIHQVTIKPFAIGKYPVSVREWNACAAANACPFLVTGREDIPVTDVSWTDAKQFVAWLTKETQKAFRLPSEAEWEYAARGGTQTKYWWGDQFQADAANCKNCAANEQPVKVGSLKPNPFGLYDMGGSVDQWVEDCWHKDYTGGPADARSWTDRCNERSRVLRGGSWIDPPRIVRSAHRSRNIPVYRSGTVGFRVARTLN